MRSHDLTLETLAKAGGKLYQHIPGCSLKTQLQAELQVAWRTRAARLSEKRVVQPDVVADEKVCVVENVEGFGAELETKSLGDPEISEE